jgi:hypothetical protein
VVKTHAVEFNWCPAGPRWLLHFGLLGGIILQSWR